MNESNAFSGARKLETARMFAYLATPHPAF